MAFSTLNASSRVTQRPAPRAVAAAVVVPRTPARARQQVALPPGRDSLRMIMRSSDTGADNDDKLVSDSGEILQGKQEKKTMGGQGMGSEDKRAEMPAQGGAPEGDMAAAGQETQLTGEPAGNQPDSGDKMPDDTSKDASQVASEEAAQQEERAPLQD